MSVNEGALFGACNPLLDISAKVDLALLKKYNLKANSAILGEDIHLGIYDDIDKQYAAEKEYIPGGSAQNSLRIASWILNTPNAATFMGCTGKDLTAQIMKKKCDEVGLRTIYQETDKLPTGKCAVLITGEDRSMVAHLAAANLFTVDHLDVAENWALVEKAKYFYISGFFFTVCPEAILRIAKHSLAENKTFSINLSAPFLSQIFKDKIMEVFPYVDTLFGNDDEARAFAENVLNLKDDNIHNIVKAIADLPKKGDKKRTVVITQGSGPVVYSVDGVIKEVKVPALSKDEIVDSNGAGDAFVGGFLAQTIKGESIEKAIDCGIWVSAVILGRSGCTFPEKFEYQ